MPPQLDQVRKAFADVLQQPWCVGVGISGSCLFRGFDPRDLDVVLWVRDRAAYEEARPTFPRVVAGLSCETFAHAVPEATRHAVLDTDTLLLYVPSHYKVLSVDPRIKRSPARDADRGRVSVVPPRPPSSPSWPASGASGADLWSQLHGYRPTGDEATDRAWMSTFASRVPCGSCRQHWQAYVRDKPPQFGTLDGWRRWTHQAHEAVNVRIGRAGMTFEQAAERWGWSAVTMPA